jgi:hypothetical protein
MRRDDRASIAIAGFANTGKTTLLRTLTKRPFGEIRDEANTSKEAVRSCALSVHDDPQDAEPQSHLASRCPSLTPIICAMSLRTLDSRRMPDETLSGQVWSPGMGPITVWRLYT